MEISAATLPSWFLSKKTRGLVFLVVQGQIALAIWLPRADGGLRTTESVIFMQHKRKNYCRCTGLQQALKNLYNMPHKYHFF
ncbi:MAG: hypothetical protein LKE33_01935 [Acidaminococcus sp.]|jgi:hypothetical protein|nr:hypothetical protein [Acidaminococcus sp.]MCI2100450.1 hypothetical protein [Acidaminococcus sp.]MCI2114771.1 hypothetical protein [Acidaminococcus sp.]MCI2116809.1 hypothetical protein [Acidaminococcus sp.]